jgi:FemAB-related protein (PEP-CTERM system-associated)
MMEFRWLNSDEGEDLWDRALDRFPESSFPMLYGWRRVYEKSLGLKTHYLLVREGEEIKGLCPLVYMKSPWLGHGNFLISLPYMTRAGILARDRQVQEEMIGRIVEKGREIKAGYIELREEEAGGSPDRFPANREHVQMVLDLPEDWGRYERGIAPRLRQVRKAQKAGLEVRMGRGEDLLNDFYLVFSRRMRELLFPVYPKKYFKTIIEVFKDQARLVLVYDRERPLGGMLLFKFKGTCSAPYVAALVQHQTSHPNQLLYYQAIRQAWEEGCRSFDFCRSQTDSGTFHFKSQWKARPKKLAYQYPLYREKGGLPGIGQARESLAFHLAEKIWPRLPLPLTQWLGGRLIRQLVLA